MSEFSSQVSALDDFKGMLKNPLAWVESSRFTDQALFEKDLQLLALKDRFALARQRDQLLKLAASANESERQKLIDALVRRASKSAAAVLSRLHTSVHIEYPESLPVSQKKALIKKAIQDNQIVIVAGETGSGKTTQLPKICLELGYGRQGLIGHTQPRRVAASSVARRVAEELQSPMGEAVAYQVRFTEQRSDKSLVKLMTDGILLAEISHDRYLNQYDCIIIDEAHERSLNIDFLLGYLKRIASKRPDLKIIITSATIDTERFSKHFNNAPIVEVKGRSFPVDMVYQPIEDLSAEKSLPSAIEQVLQVIDEDEQSNPEASGDVLVFLPGEGEIREVSKALRHSTLSAINARAEVMPLYSRLNSAEQEKIFKPAKKGLRKIVLATNVAETSLTVPGIRYVIDSGLARVSRYSHRSKVQQLPIEKISQAAANQRAGRCGRMAAGVCFRLYSEDDFTAREAFTQPEIQRTNLSQVILQMQRLGIGDVGKFEFIDAPDKRLINDGFKQLFELGALDDKRRLTALGKKLSRLPIDPQLSRILLQADKEQSLTQALIIVSVMSIQDPREEPADKREAARQKHSAYKDTDSDFIALLNLWNAIEEQRQALSKNQFKRWCQKQFLSAQRVHEWREIHRQLLVICRELKLRFNEKPASLSAIHRALLTGFMSHVGFQSEFKQFSGVRNKQFRVFPGSYLSKKPPKWIVAGQLLETSQLFAHKVGKIEPDWIEELAPHLIKETFHEPHFSQKQGQVLAWRTAALYGLQISDKKRVSFGQIDPRLARELFIREGLVAEQLRINAPFYQHNRNLRKDAELLEAKTRRRDIVVSDEAIFEFYNRLLPDDIVNAQSLEKWRKTYENKHGKKALFASKALFLQDDMQGFDGTAFPDAIEWQGLRYPVSYSFEPGSEQDGVTVTVPLEGLNRVPKYLFEWLVPGLLPEKCEAMLKCLPKQLRKQLVPLPDLMADLMPKLERSNEPLSQVLASQIKHLRRVTIKPDDWQLDKLDDFYLMNVRLLDAVEQAPSQAQEQAQKKAPEAASQQSLNKLLSKSGGKPVQADTDKPSKPKHKAKSNKKPKQLAQSRDIDALLEAHRDAFSKTLEETGQSVGEKTQYYTTWSFEDLPKQRRLKTGKVEMLCYPALSDEVDKVAIINADTPFAQQTMHLQGLCRLALLQLASLCKYIKKESLKGNAFALVMPPELEKKQLLDDVLMASIKSVFFQEHQPISKAGFESLLQKHRSELTGFALSLDKMLLALFQSDFQLRKQLSEITHSAFKISVDEIRAHRARLMSPGLLMRTPSEHLLDLSRYMQALEHRVSRLKASQSKDEAYALELMQWQEKMDGLLDDTPSVASLPAFEHLRWMLEEYRVSLFAQQLKTKMPISAKRLQKQWEKVQSEKNTQNF